MHSFKRGFGLMLGVVFLSCGGREAVPPKPPEETRAPVEASQQGDAIARLLATMAEQDRVNHYFHREVLPKLKSCWSGLKGEGAIAVRVSYRRYDSLWTAGESGVNKSTLANDQEQLALRCLAESVSNTSFPAEGPDGDATEYQVNWSLPVPWPTDLGEVAKLMALDSGDGGGGGGGGCGGDSVPGCQDCWNNILFVKFSLCVPACSGYIDCTLEADGNGCRMKTKCISAPIFGNRGGFVIY